ncbi:Ig-like domain-containing protein, partial [Peptoniphilus genitalis]
MTYVEGTDGKLKLDGLKVVVRDTLGGIEVFNYDTTTNKFKDGDTALDGFTVKVEDKAVEQNTVLTSVEHNNKKITVAYGQKSDETVQALKVTKTLPAPVVDDVKKGDKTVNVTVPNNGETKITVKVGDKEVVAEKDPQDSQWKVGGNPVDIVKGKLQIPVEELKQGDVVKVTTEDPAGNTAETEKQVPVDEYSKDPTEVKAKNDPATPDKTTVTGKATPGAVITIQDKDGKVLTTEPKEVKADNEGNFKATIEKKEPSTLLLVSAKEDGKEPSADVPAQVVGSSDVVEKKPGVDKPKGFVTVTFAIKDADQSKGTLEGATAYYVNPKVRVQLNPPKFKAETGFKLDGWDKKDQMTIPANKYTTDRTIYAVIGEVPDIVDASGNTEKPAGYVEVRFGLDTSKAKFDDNAVTKYYVNPTKEIKLTAPGVKVTDPAYTFEGWEMLTGTDKSLM